MTDDDPFANYPPALRRLASEGLPADQEQRLQRLEAAILELANGAHQPSADGGAAVQDRVADIEATVAELEQTVDSLSGLAEGQQSTPEKRATDACLGLINQAEADDPDAGQVSWTYREVQSFLEANGHGTVHPPQAYDVIEALDDVDGFVGTTNRDGQRVIRCNLRRVNADAAVNEINNGTPAEGTTDTPETEVNTSEPR